MKQEDWKKVMQDAHFEDSAYVQKQMAHESALVESYMQEQNISDYDVAERELAEQGKIFGELEVRIEDVRHGRESDFWGSRPSPRPEMEAYERISRRAVQEFNQRAMKPKTIVFPNVHTDASYAGAYVGARWKDEDGLYPHINDVIEEFNAQSDVFRSTGGSAVSMFFGYKLPEKTE